MCWGNQSATVGSSDNISVNPGDGGAVASIPYAHGGTYDPTTGQTNKNYGTFGSLYGINGQTGGLDTSTPQLAQLSINQSKSTGVGALKSRDSDADQQLAGYSQTATNKSGLPSVITSPQLGVVGMQRPDGATIPLINGGLQRAAQVQGQPSRSLLGVSTTAPSTTTTAGTSTSPLGNGLGGLLIGGAKIRGV